MAGIIGPTGAQQVGVGLSNGFTFQTLEIILLAGVVSPVVGAVMIEIAKFHRAAAVLVTIIVLVIAYFLFSQVLA
jgi:ABC-type multidrug transport system permease subunit